MFATAVLCTDASADSDKLLAIAPRLRQFGIGRLLLVCPVSEADRAREAEIGARLLEQETALAEKGFEVHGLLRHGTATTVVAAVLAETGAELAIVGVQGVGRGSRLLVGGAVGEHGVTLPGPLLSLRIGATGCNPLHTLSHTPMLARVLLATDFSPASEGAVEATLGLVVRGGISEVVLFHVTAEKVPAMSDRLRIRALADRVRAAGRVHVVEEIVSGTPAEAITYRVQTGDITLTVLGSRGHGLFEEILVGSVGAEVARHLESPLLMVPGLTGSEEAARQSA